MSDPKLNESGDDALGLNTTIDRRDLLNSTLLAAGSMLLSSMAPLQLLAEEDWTGYGGVGEYARSNGNTYEVMTDGHKIRDHVYERASTDAIDTGENFDCVIVGGGISGLAAALFFQRESGPNRTCLVLENHPIFGGEAKRNEFNVDGQRLMVHQGSAACFPPLPDTFLQTFYDSIGVDWSQFQYQEWTGKDPAVPLETAPYPGGGKTSGFFFWSKVWTSGWALAE